MNEFFITLDGVMIITQYGVMIALISLGLSVMSTAARIIVLGKHAMKEMKERMKQHQQDLKDATKSGDKKKAQQAQDDLMKLTMENMKHSFKPMIITFIPFILVFGWLKTQYESVGQVANIFGFGFEWFWWYFICAIIFSMVINKIFKLD